MHVQVNMMGRGYDVVQGIPDQLELADSAGIDDALRTLAGLLPPGRSLPASCLVVLNGQHCGTVRAHENTMLRDNDELALIAPVAGG